MNSEFIEYVKPQDRIDNLFERFPEMKRFSYDKPNVMNIDLEVSKINDFMGYEFVRIRDILTVGTVNTILNKLYSRLSFEF